MMSESSYYDGVTLHHNLTQNGSATIDNTSAKRGTYDTSESDGDRQKHSSDTGTKPRETWSRKIDFILSAIGFAVGLGNVWRFPYLCYVNGGGAFLVPYVIMMTFLGLPLFYLELALGQYASLGPITVWRVCPLFKGIGYTMIGVSSVVSIYYNVILAVTIFYLFASFTSRLPWIDCGNSWNVACSTNIYASESHCVTNETSTLPQNITMTTIASLANSTDDAVNTNDSVTMFTNFLFQTEPSNSTADALCSSVANLSMDLQSPAEEYWKYYVLGSTNATNIGNIGGVRWHLALCLLLAWIIVCLCIIKGVKSSGKVVYFTATFPYVVLFILFIRGVTLPGAANGIKYYVYPDFSRLADAKVWHDAAVQILFSLSIGFGGLEAMGSYNKFNNKCNRDAVLVTLINCGTSLFAGFVIFAILGFMAEKNNVPVDKVVAGGPGLAFIAYPEAVAMMPAAPFWSICFFIMLFTLGLDSQFVGVECIVTGLMDEFETIRRWKKTTIVVVCSILFLVGLPCITQGGMYVVELMDKFALSYPLLIVVLLEVIVIAWIYGYRRFASDVESMLGHRPNYFWVTCWVVISPILLLFVLIFSSVEGVKLEYDGFIYPSWATGVGWLISAVLMSVIPILAIVAVCRCIGSFRTLAWFVRSPRSFNTISLRSLVTPDERWGPALEQNRRPRTGVSVVEGEGVEENYAVAYREGQCFVTEAAFYNFETNNDSHI